MIKSLRSNCHQKASKSKVAQSCLTLCNPMDCSLPGSSHGIFQAKVLEWVAISFSRGSSPPRDRTWVSLIVGRCFTVSATRQESSRKTSTSALLTMLKPLTVDHNKMWKILKEMRIPDHLTCLLRNLYAGQEATVRTGHGTADWLKIRKGVCQSSILSPCLFNLYAEYIMRNAGLDEAQVGIKTARRNINNLR